MPKIPAEAGTALTQMRRWPLLVPSGRARLVSIVFGVLVLFGSVGQVAIARMTALPENAVLRTGNTVVTRMEFRQRLEVLEALYGIRPPKEGPQLDRFHRDAAKSVAVSLILDSAAQDRNVAVNEKQAHNALAEIVAKQVPGGRDAFVEFLGSHGIAEHDVLDEVARHLAISRLFSQITADVQPVTNITVREAYQERRKDLVAPERRHLRNIVVGSKADATAILGRARAGADFAVLASKYSLDQSTKNKGGDLGTLTAEQLDSGYAGAAFKAEEGSAFGPVKTRYGWNVGQVVGIDPARQLSFDRVDEQLEAQLNSKKKLDIWRSWLGNQIRAADVEYAEEYRPANPVAPPSDAVPR